jgi:hypothetical protein
MRTTHAFLLTMLTVAPGALAQESSAEMVEKGVRLRREHRDAEALQQFRRADQLNPAPRIRAQIAFAEQALAQWVEAEKDLNQALAANEDPWIHDHEDALKKALASIQQHLGTLTIETNASGAELWINGIRSGTLPMSPARVSAGPVDVELRSTGYQTARRTVSVNADQVVTERIELTRAASAPSAERAAKTNFATGDFAPAVTSTQRVVAWGTLGGAVVLLIGAGAAELEAHKNASHYTDDTICGPTITQSREGRCGSYRGQAETAQTFANLGFIGAGALGAASAILFFTAPRAGRGKSSAVWMSPTPGGFALGWRASLQ